MSREPHRVRHLSDDSPTELFRSLVRDAMASHRIVSSETTEFYLVKLLEGFIHPVEPVFAHPLGVAYLQALRATPVERFGALKRVADTSLFVSGLFPQSLERRLVGPEYYAALGQRAYSHLCDLPRPPALGDVFGELSRRFSAFAEVLTEISFDVLFRSDLDTLRAYQRWFYRRSQRDAELLMRRGLLPVDPPGRPRH
jgi:hypothetical protein